MQKNILWTGIEYHSVENCILTITDKGAKVTSSIVGKYANELYKIEYRIRINQFWETTSFEMESQLHNTMKRVRFRRQGKGRWFVNGRLDKKLNGCIDIDISLTPFTNALPINRLKPAENQVEQIMVLYVDVLGEKIMPVQQKYTRLSDADFKFENVPNDFESVISVDELGLVVEYPGLFKRTYMADSNYRTHTGFLK
jgi:uncharacterized protein